MSRSQAAGRPGIMSDRYIGPGFYQCGKLSDMLGRCGLDHSMAEIEDERTIRQGAQNPDGRIPESLAAGHKHDRIKVALDRHLGLKLGSRPFRRYRGVQTER